ncbi:MAG: YbdK family carboxylate-amine ligase [Longimicrobiales bacterium]
MRELEFKASEPFTVGVELELQLVDRHAYDLTRAAPALLALLEGRPHAEEVKLEITQSMVEAATGVHFSHESLLEELKGIRNALVAATDELGVGIAGGGAHPFQHWSERRISDRPRFQQVSDLYGYLAKLFTVFGQHIHIGCRNGDEALHLLHAMAGYMPHLIALSASSPYYQGVDTAFESSRLNSVLAFPLSGRAPFLLRWCEFEAYYGRMRQAGIVGSMKDFYWDVRPNAGFGTIEIRVCDTPLTVERAASVATYAKMLARWLLAERGPALTEDLYLSYSFNRFQACRFGMEGEVVDMVSGTRRVIREDILATLEKLRGHPVECGEREALDAIEAVVRDGNDARWIREQFAATDSFACLMESQASRFRGD